MYPENSTGHSISVEKLENGQESRFLRLMKFRFADSVLDTEAHVLTTHGETVRVEPQVFDLLHLLVRQGGQLVSRDQIIEDVWGGRIVSESAISARINAVRTAVGDDGKTQAIVRTVPRRGFQLVAPVETEQGQQPSPAPTTQHQTLRYVTSPDGSRIAYAASGKGPGLLRAGHFLTHLEHDWSSPVWRPYLDVLQEGRQLIRYDQRGTGLSEPNLKNPSLENYVADLLAVADAAGLDRFPLVALSQGVPVAVRLAAEHPERVSCLILYGGYCEGRAVRDGGQSVDEAHAMRTLMREGWGKPESAFMAAFTSLFCPGANAEQRENLVEMQLASASVENATDIREAIDRFVVSDVLARVAAPTLVIHARGDAVHPLAEGQKLAAGIPGAEFVTLDSNNHIALPTDAVWPNFTGAIREFLTRHAS